MDKNKLANKGGNESVKGKGKDNALPMVGNASLSRMAAEWIRDWRRRRRARARESKGRWVRG